MSNIINDKEKAMIAIQNNAWAFVENVSDDLKKDKDFLEFIDKLNTT